MKRSAMQCIQWGKTSILELDLMVEQREWWEVLEVSRTASKSFQKSVFEFCLYLGFIVLLFKNEYPNFGNSKGLQQSIESTSSISQRMGVVFCKDSWNSDWGKSMCYIHVFCFVKMEWWCQGNRIVSFVWVEEFIVPYVSWNYSSRGSPMRS